MRRCIWWGFDEFQDKKNPLEVSRGRWVDTGSCFRYAQLPFQINASQAIFVQNKTYCVRVVSRGIVIHVDYETSSIPLPVFKVLRFYATGVDGFWCNGKKPLDVDIRTACDFLGFHGKNLSMR